MPKGARYDFDLRTGESETGLKACTYTVEVRNDNNWVENVWVETPGGGTNWRLVELRPVSEGALKRDVVWKPQGCLQSCRVC